MSDFLSLTFLAAQLCRIHRLAQYFHSQTACLLEIAIIFVVLFQKTLRTCIIRSYARCLPASVVATWVALI